MKEKLLRFFNKHRVLKVICKPIYNRLRSIHFFIKLYILFMLQGLCRLIFLNRDSNISKIKKLHNVNKGKRCFIIATGPSLKKEDVDVLYKNNEYTFGVNSIYKLYEDLQYKPTYYVCADDDYVKLLLEETNNSFFDNKADIYSFTDLSVKKRKVKYSDNLLFIPYNRLLHAHRTFLDYHFLFSLNPVFGLYDYYTVTALAINLAAYMGFSKIYLLGVDCNYMGKTMHANGIETGLEHIAIATEANKIYAAYSMQKGYEYLQKKLLKHGINVYNATRGGALEVFPRVNFDEVIKTNK